MYKVGWNGYKALWILIEKCASLLLFFIQIHIIVLIKKYIFAVDFEFNDILRLILFILNKWQPTLEIGF